MEKQTHVQVAVIGQSLTAIGILLHLIEKKTFAKMAWFQSPKDREQYKLKRWFFSPKECFYPSAQMLEDNEICFFLNSKDRLDLNSFLNENTLHPALSRKIYSTAFWNDLSPNIYNLKGEPDPSWIQKMPDSWSPKKNIWKPNLMALHDALPYFQNSLQKKGVEVFHDDKVVLDFNKSLSGGPKSLIHNAPFQLSLAENVYCCYDTQPMNLQPKAFWKTSIFSVPRAFVTALPTFSIHLVSPQAENFYNFAIWKSGALKRVIKIVEPQEGKAWIQIESLEFYSTKSEPSPESRADYFLWDLCPFLRNENLNSLSLSFYESALFPTIQGIHQKEKGDVSYFFLGPSSRLEDLALNGIQQGI